MEWVSGYRNRRKQWWNLYWSFIKSIFCIGWFRYWSFITLPNFILCLARVLLSYGHLSRILAECIKFDAAHNFNIYFTVTHLDLILHFNHRFVCWSKAVIFGDLTNIRCKYSITQLLLSLSIYFAILFPASLSFILFFHTFLPSYVEN